MHLGAFSLSLSVKDLAASQIFYQKLGFEVFAGNADEHWLIMRSGDHVIGLFEGMFDKNMLTFNPGWDQKAQPLESFQSISDIRQTLIANGILSAEDEAENENLSSKSILLHDPDGNPVLIDQHVDAS
ncbi:MAG: VOC family protein [Pseudomonadota bacterium]